MLTRFQRRFERFTVGRTTFVLQAEIEDLEQASLFVVHHHTTIDFVAFLWLFVFVVPFSISSSFSVFAVGFFRIGFLAVRIIAF